MSCAAFALPIFAELGCKQAAKTGSAQDKSREKFAPRGLRLSGIGKVPETPGKKHQTQQLKTSS
jgi:hypothetical protein